MLIVDFDFAVERNTGLKSKKRRRVNLAIGGDQRGRVDTNSCARFEIVKPRSCTYGAKFVISQVNLIAREGAEIGSRRVAADVFQ